MPRSRSAPRALSLVLTIVAASLALAAPAPAATVADLQLLTSTDGAPQAQLELAVRPGSESVDRVVFLKTADGSKLEDVQLEGIVEGKPLAITPVGGQAGAKFTIEQDGLVAVRVSAADPKPGTGELIASAGGRARKLADIEVKRNLKAVLSVVGAGEEGLKVATTASLFKRDIDIVSAARRPVTDLRIRVAPFTGAQSQQAVPTVTVGEKNEPLDPNKDYSVGDLGSLQLHVQAELTANGDHTSSIVLAYGDERTVIPLVVTRTRVALNLNLDTPDADATDIWGQNGSAEFDLVLRENEGRTLLLPTPIVTVKRTDGDRVRTVAPDKVTIDGKAPGPIPLDPDQPTKLRVKVDGLPGPGLYTARIEFGGGQGAPTHVDATAHVRRQWLWALLLILASVFLSDLVRRRWRTTRLRLVAQRELADLSEDLERIVAATGTTEDEERYVQELRSQLWDAFSELDLKPDKDVTSTVTAVRGKLRLVARWLAVSAAAHRAGAPEALKQRLRGVGATLAGTGAEVGDSEKTLTEVADALALGADLGPRIRALRASFQEWRGSRGDDEVPAAAADVDKKLTEARDALDMSDPVKAKDAYQAAWAGWRTAVADELQKLAAGDAPTGVDAGEWSKLGESIATSVGTIQNAETPEEGLAAYRAAYGRYLAVVANGLRTEVEKRAKADGADTAALEPISAGLTATTVALERDDLASAYGSYSEAAAAFKELPAPAAGPSRMGGAPLRMAAGDKTTALPGAPASQPEGFEGGPISVPNVMMWPSTQSLTKRLEKVELLITIVVAGLAGLIGLLVLWEPNSTWGDLADIGLAILWGFGLHQVTNAAIPAGATFSGIEGLARQVSGETGSTRQGG
jgi:hypothetical protein